MSQKICLVAAALFLSLSASAQDGLGSRDDFDAVISRVTLWIESIEEEQKEMPKKMADREAAQEASKAFDGMFERGAANLRDLLTKELSDADRDKLNSLVDRFNIAVFRASYLEFYVEEGKPRTGRRRYYWTRMLPKLEAALLTIKRSDQTPEEEKRVFEEALASYKYWGRAQDASDEFRAIFFRLGEVEGFYSKVFVFLFPWKAWEEVKPLSKGIRNRFECAALLSILDSPPRNRRMFIKMVRVARKIEHAEQLAAFELVRDQFNEIAFGMFFYEVSERSVSPLSYVLQVQSPEQAQVFAHFTEIFFATSKDSENRITWESEEKEWMFPTVFGRLGDIQKEVTAEAILWSHGVAVQGKFDPKQLVDWAFGVEEDLVFSEFKAALPVWQIDPKAREFLVRLGKTSKAK